MSEDDKLFRGIPIVQSGQKYQTDAGFRAVKNGQKVRRDSAPVVRGDKPKWLRAKMPSGSGYAGTRKIVHEHRLSTVCEDPRAGWMQKSH
jgi:lipoic acid synthetase